jgi:hypothetical protein
MKVHGCSSLTTSLPDGLKNPRISYLDSYFGGLKVNARMYATKVMCVPIASFLNPVAVNYFLIK